MVLYSSRLSFKTISRRMFYKALNLPRKMISNSTKRKAADQGIYRPLKIIREEIVKSPVELTQQLNSNDINRIRKNIYHEHRKNYPILPKSLTHDTIKRLKIKTNIDEDFLLDNNSEKNIIIFLSKKNLKYICEKSIIFVDGTFSHCPNFFYQMFTLHTLLKIDRLIIIIILHIPLIFALLPNKTIETYKNMFKIIVEKCNEFGLLFMPNLFVADFEQAIHNAINEMFPLSKIIGCRFYLSQSWYRNIQNLGLTTDYRSETEIGKWLRNIFGLSFLNAVEVGESYTDDFMSTIPENQAVQEFNTISSQRTTNACESFHAKFNKSFSSPHPNIFVFIDVLTQLQIDTYIIMQNTDTRPLTTRYQKKK
ncbi:MULE domain-containing protein [Aphis craccivora]|uniref:MULE domain-containing protein n=1 Tax=Aphis craccivora TaxID=307492 RepID=A0A6G0W1F8_APHCR|nr:MULE domain-containing protein [Aphis craccivora]